jgi:hypothetical protein
MQDIFVEYVEAQLPAASNTYLHNVDEKGN